MYVAGDAVILPVSPTTSVFIVNRFDPDHALEEFVHRNMGDSRFVQLAAESIQRDEPFFMQVQDFLQQGARHLDIFLVREFRMLYGEQFLDRLRLTASDAADLVLGGPASLQEFVQKQGHSPWIIPPIGLVQRAGL